ncbi:alpha/beta hydrolase-fold protein [Streptomyces sp. CdTB01]|uniref:alpha/beta hydrolase n=1 Tax=Streptomyces sp. CdTB01 TaxID=1725411 RepID=UPI00073AB0FE|nr:alpha/beta hydrolase-fold protein [Streptomyces sp. CdTB01]ALV39211.1 esterase [Streptomyces sp. CdTB01]
MGMTSKKVLLLAVAAALLLFTLTVCLWPRLARNSVPSVLGRIAMLLATQLSILAAGGLAVNLTFGFYSSWADLAGTDEGNGVVVEGGGGAATQLQVRGALPVGVPGGGSPNRAGRIEKVQINGASTGITAPAYVYLPPQYFQAPYSRSRFPAVLVLTGYPGTAEYLITQLDYPQIATRSISAGTMRPTVLVMMRPTVAPPRDTECVDVPGGPRAETFFTRDLRTAIASRYRVGEQARSWGVIGNSTGGYCALKMAMRAPQAFSAAAGLSSSYRAPQDRTTGDLFGGSRQLEKENDLLWRLDKLPMPPVSVLVTSSKVGESNYTETRTFLAKARPPLHVASIILASGGHNFNTWSREIPAALDWLSNRLNAP